MPSHLSSASMTSPPPVLRTDGGIYPGERLIKLLLTDTSWINTLAIRDTQLAGRDLQLANLIGTIAQRLGTIWSSPQYQLALESFPIVGRNVYSQPYIPDSGVGEHQTSLPDNSLRPTSVLLVGKGWRSRDDGEGKFPASGPFLGGWINYSSGVIDYTYAMAQVGVVVSYVHDFWLSISSDDLPAEGAMTPPFDPNYVDATSYPIDAANTDYEMAERDRAIFSVLGGWCNFLQRFDPTDSFQYPLVQDPIIAPISNPLFVTDVWSRGDGIPELNYPTTLSPWGPQDIANSDKGLAWRDNVLAGLTANVANLWNTSARWLRVANRIHVRKIAPALVQGVGITTAEALSAPGGMLGLATKQKWDWDVVTAIVSDSSGTIIKDNNNLAVLDGSRSTGVRWQDARRAPQTLHLIGVTQTTRTWSTETPGDAEAGLIYDIVNHKVQPVSGYQDVYTTPEVAAMGFGGDASKGETVQLVTAISPDDDLTSLSIKASGIGSDSWIKDVTNGKLWAEPITGTSADYNGLPQVVSGAQFWGSNPCAVQAGASIRLTNVLDSLDPRQGILYQVSVSYKLAQTLERPCSQCDSSSSGVTAQADGSLLLSAPAATNFPNSITDTPSLSYTLTLPAGLWRFTLNTTPVEALTRWSCWLAGNLVASSSIDVGGTSFTFQVTLTSASQTFLFNLDSGPAGVVAKSLTASLVSCAIQKNVPLVASLYLEKASSGKTLLTTSVGSSFRLTDRRGRALRVAYTDQSWVTAKWTAKASNGGLILAEDETPILSSSGELIAGTGISKVVDISPEVIHTQALPNRHDILSTAYYSGDELSDGAYAIRVDFSSAVSTPIELTGWSITKVYPSDRQFRGTFKSKRRYSEAALNILAKGWSKAAASGALTSSLTELKSSFSSTQMYAWLADLGLTIPNLADAIRPSLPSDVGQPCIVPATLYWSTVCGATSVYSVAGLTPQLKLLQPWHLELGACVLKESYWDVPQVLARTPLFT